jgi:hypothetical protein
MEQRPTTVRVWAGLTEVARCRDCHKTIVWRTRMDTGKSLPFDPGFTVREAGRDVRENQYHLLAFADLHQCTQRPPKKRERPARLF